MAEERLSSSGAGIAGDTELGAIGRERAIVGPWQFAWRRFRRHKLAVASCFIIAVIAASAILAQWISPKDPYYPDMRAIRKPPTSEHLLGTDGSGRDVLARMLYGGRVSLSVGLVAVSIYLTIGTVLGAVAGYRRGVTDQILMRLTDTIMCFPTLLIILSVVPVVGPSIFNIMIVIGFLGWTGIARLVRGEFLSLRERDFVLAARCLGSSDRRVIFRHVLPNVVGPIIVAATFGIPGAIMSEAGLSFLGLGVQAPMASWGNILNAANDLTTLQYQPWLWMPPGIMIAVTVLCINFIGDGLRDALDPRVILEK